MKKPKYTVSTEDLKSHLSSFNEEDVVAHFIDEPVPSAILDSMINEILYYRNKYGDTK